MALSATRLRTAIRAAMLADPAIEAIDDAGLTALCAAIATAVVNEVKLATVTVPATGIASPPGVAGGPCLGIATGTIT